MVDTERYEFLPTNVEIILTAPKYTGSKWALRISSTIFFFAAFFCVYKTQKTYRKITKLKSKFYLFLG